METLENVLKILREHKKELRGKFKVKEIKVFGSYARGEQSKKSDVDIMVEFEEIPDFFKFVRLERHLEKILGVRVDLQTRESISPYIREYIEREVRGV